MDSSDVMRGSYQRWHLPFRAMHRQNAALGNADDTQFSPSISSSGCFLSVNFGFKISQLESIDDGEFHIAMFFRMPHFLLACRIRCRYFITL